MLLSMHHVRRTICTALLGCSLLRLEADPVLPAPPLEALIVGGGPNRNSNAAQIEGHVRFVSSLLPATALRRVLFADGDRNDPTGSYMDTGAAANARRALSILGFNNNARRQPVLFRKPDLGIPTDGSSSLASIHRAFTDLLAAGKPHEPVLLYFAGHGGRDGAEENTEYNLWKRESLAVHDLSAEIARLPADTPVVLVMVQCFSGAFADLLFQNGNPKGGLAPQNLAGFFSAQKDREASGCGWTTGAADYQDFSSYFFGALCGRDRFGRPVSGADFDGDGRVSLHEAFCYALGHDDSFDTPTCTSYIFLRRFAPLSDREIYNTPYAEALRSASPGQRAALETLSQKLGLAGEDRALVAWGRQTIWDPQRTFSQLASYKTARRLNALRETTLQELLQRWPALKKGSPKADYLQSMAGASKELAANPSLSADLLAADIANNEAGEAMDNEEALLLRFTKLYAGVVAAQHLREHGTEKTKVDFERLWAAEQQSPPLRKATASN